MATPIPIPALVPTDMPLLLSSVKFADVVEVEVDCAAVAVIAAVSGGEVGLFVGVEVDVVTVASANIERSLASHATVTGYAAVMEVPQFEVHRMLAS